jgi:hypothetical protein
VIAAGRTSVAAGTRSTAITDAFEQGKQLEAERCLEPRESGEPQTIMLIGSDRRAQSTVDDSTGRALDTIMLSGSTRPSARPRCCRCRAT